MGLRFRKSLGKGVRINISKSGVGYSVGSKGYRITKLANGRTRETISVPGTGVSYVSESSSGSKKVKVNSCSSSSPKISTVYLIFIIIIALGILITLISWIDTARELKDSANIDSNFSIEYKSYELHNNGTYGHIYFTIYNQSNNFHTYSITGQILSSDRSVVIATGTTTVSVSKSMSKNASVTIYPIDERIVLEQGVQYHIVLTDVKIVK